MHKYGTHKKCRQLIPYWTGQAEILKSSSDSMQIQFGIPLDNCVTHEPDLCKMLKLKTTGNLKYNNNQPQQVRTLVYYLDLKLSTILKSYVFNPLYTIWHFVTIEPTI